MTDYTSEDQIPYGYCHCGCGQKTNLRKRNDYQKGHIKEQPAYYIVGHVNRRTTEQEITSFWSKVLITADDNQCWLWQYGKNGHGYGLAKVGKEQIASRIAWSYPDYVIPKDMEVCHSCDNPTCCNPKHLFLGTHQENMEDMVRKGRSPKAKGLIINRQQNRRKITKEEELEIIEEYGKYDISQKELAKKHNVALNHVQRLIHSTR